MKRFYTLLLFVSMILIAVSSHAQDATPEATAAIDAPPEPAIVVEEDGIELALFFDELRQGRAGLARVLGEDIQAASSRIFVRQIDFFPVPDDDALYALLVTDLEQPIRTYEFDVEVELISGETQTLQTSFEVVSGGFIQQDVTLVGDGEDLLDEEIEAQELDQLFALAAPHTPNVLWDEAGFGAPINGELTSPFGAVRTFNETYNSRHTGWDFQAVIGEPMVASAAGEVAFAGRFPLRGNYVLLNHGRGVYSGYAHLSVTHVTQGQAIAAGQILGQVGSTGRSSSAHAHVEFIVDERWVDAADFIRMYLP